MDKNKKKKNLICLIRGRIRIRGSDPGSETLELSTLFSGSRIDPSIKYYLIVYGTIAAGNSFFRGVYIKN